MSLHYALDGNPKLHNSPESLTQAALEAVVTTLALKCTPETGLNLRRSYGLLTDLDNLLAHFFTLLIWVAGRLLLVSVSSGSMAFSL